MSLPIRAALIAMLIVGLREDGVRAETPTATGDTPLLVALEPPQTVQPAARAEGAGLEENAPTWQLLAGAGFNLLAPFTDNNRAFTVTVPGPGGSAMTQSTDFGNPVAVAPRFWLGLASPSGWGFRAGYWNFEQTSSLRAVLDGGGPAGSAIASASPLGVGIATGTFLLGSGNADVLTATNRLNLSVLDFELTREIEAGRFFLMLSAGGRYAQLGQHYNATVVNTSNNFLGNAELDQLFSHQRFTGGGPTVALQGWYPLGRTRLSLYGLARGAILFGSNCQDAAATTITAVGGLPAETQRGQVSGSRNAAVPVGELEIGVQWTAVWGRFTPFVRTGVVAQTWFNALTATTVPTLAGDSASLNTNLSFVGVALQAGLCY
jgi:hypothetical protein